MQSSKECKFNSLNASVPFADLRKTLARVSSEKMRGIIEDFLSQLEDSTDFFDSMAKINNKIDKDDFDLLINKISNARNRLKLADGNDHSKGLCNCIIEKTESILKEFKNTYIPEPVKITKTTPDCGGFNLKLQQGLISNSPKHTNSLKVILDGIPIDYGCSTCIYYTESNNPNLSWVSNFLQILVTHLKMAGIPGISLIAGTPGMGLLETQEKILKAKTFIIVGTEALLETANTGYTQGILGLVWRRIQEKKQNIPLLISGEHHTSFPSLAHLFYEDAKKYTYLNLLKKLISLIYGTNENKFDELWDSFFKTLDPSTKNLLKNGFTEFVILKHLESEKVKKEQEAHDSYVSSLKVLGLSEPDGKQSMPLDSFCPGDAKSSSSKLPLVTPEERFCNLMTNARASFLDFTKGESKAVNKLMDGVLLYKEIIDDKPYLVFGIEKDSQKNLDFAQLRSKIAGTLGFNSKTKFTQVIGDSFPFNETATEFARKYIANELNQNEESRVIFYGCTGKKMGDSRSDTNRIVSEWLDYDDKETIKQNRVIANVVDKDSLRMVKEHGFNIAKNIRNFILVYTNTPQPQAGFGADAPLDALTNGKMICMNGGVQSFLQMLNAVNNNVPVIGISNLRSKDKDNFHLITKKTYLSACDLISQIKNTMGSGKSLQKIISEYLRSHALFNADKPDSATKQALWDQSMLLLKSIWPKLHLFQSLDSNSYDYKLSDASKDQKDFRDIFSSRSFVRDIRSKLLNKHQSAFSVMGLMGDEPIQEIHDRYQTLVNEFNPETGRVPNSERFNRIKSAYKNIKNAKLHDLNSEDPEKLFGVDDKTTNADIEKAYKKLSKTFHPDRFESKENDLQKIEIARLTLQFKKLLILKNDLIAGKRKSKPDAKETKQTKADTSKDPFYKSGDQKTSQEPNKGDQSRLFDQFFSGGLFSGSFARPSDFSTGNIFDPMKEVKLSELYIQNRIQTYKNSKNQLVNAIANNKSITEITQIIGANRDYLGTQDKDNNNLVHIACLTGRDDVLLLLHKYNCDFEAKNTKGMNAASIVVITGSVKCLKVLTEVVKVNHLYDSIGFRF